jgi:hypothetical protein
VIKRKLILIWVEAYDRFFTEGLIEYTVSGQTTPR